MRKRILLTVVAGAAVASLIAYSISTLDGRSRTERLVECIHDAGYHTVVFHDNGIVTITDADAAILVGSSVQARPPADKVTVYRHGQRFGTGYPTAVTIPEGSPIGFDYLLGGTPHREITAIRSCIATA
jgi:hypothetical protein